MYKLTIIGKRIHQAYWDANSVQDKNRRGRAVDEDGNRIF